MRKPCWVPSTDLETSVYATLARAVAFFERTFTDYVQTGNPNDVPLLKEISLSLGQSWGGLVQKWNDAAQQNDNSSVFLQEYKWYVESINSIFQVIGISISKPGHALIRLPGISTEPGR